MISNTQAQLRRSIRIQNYYVDLGVVSIELERNVRKFIESSMASSAAEPTFDCTSNYVPK